MNDETVGIQTWVKYFRSFNLIHKKLAVFFLMLLLLSPTRILAAPTAENIIKMLALTQDQVLALDQGKIVTFESNETSQKELALGLSIYLPLPPEKFVAYFKHGNLASIDPDIVLRHDLQLEPNSNNFKEFTFTLKQIKEVERLLNFSNGTQFNLSAEETQNFSLLKEKLVNASKASLITEVSQHYREILKQRLFAYRKNGLLGIAPYIRDGSTASPAEELHSAATSIALLERVYPNLYQSWLNYPAPLPSIAEEKFYWLNRKVENRSTAILGHQVLQTSNNSSIILVRQFFVGHSYNSSQLIVSCLPYRDGSIIFYFNQVFTDQISGIGSSLKHTIGSKLMKEKMIENLKQLHSNVQSF